MRCVAYFALTDVLLALRPPRRHHRLRTLRPLALRATARHPTLARTGASRRARTPKPRADRPPGNPSFLRNRTTNPLYLSIDDNPRPSLATGAGYLVQHAAHTGASSPGLRSPSAGWQSAVSTQVVLNEECRQPLEAIGIFSPRSTRMTSTLRRCTGELVVRHPREPLDWFAVSRSPLPPRGFRRRSTRASLMYVQYYGLARLSIGFAIDFGKVWYG